MESLNSYASDGESDSSLNTAVSKKSSVVGEEADANCEPITMDMSEDSSSSHSDDTKKKETEKPQAKRSYSSSLSPSPAPSYSSRDSADSGRRRRSKANDEKERQVRSSSERSKSGPVKDRRYDDDKHKYDKEYKRNDDRDRKHRDTRRDRYSDRDSDRYGSKRHERKRSHRSRSRSTSYSRHRSSKRKGKSRSRSRSYDRYQRRNSPRRNNYKRKSPYKSRRSRSKSPVHEKPRSYDWKSTSKLKVLEKLGIELKIPPGGIEVAQGIAPLSAPSNAPQLTPQLLLQKTMEEQVEKVKSATGIALPSYYNPIAVNPSKYAEQIQKRRLLWGNKDKQANPAPSEESAASKETESKSSGTIWQGATFGGDQDGKMTAKFQRLMGIKNVSQDAPPEVKANGSDLIKKQEEMFHSMESQYEVARLATHSHRGLGLGFGTFQPR